MKTVDEIYTDLLESFASRAGYTPNDSCDLAVRLYAVAAELQALSIQADWVLDQSFPQTAEGESLDYHAQLRSLSRNAAVKATGTIRFFVNSTPSANLIVEEGTVCMTRDAVRFETTQTATLSTGKLFVDIPAQAVESGATGNAAAETVTFMAACPVGITSCTNPEAFAGGCDAEDDESLRTRILESYHRLPNGANAAYYERTAMAHSGVVAAKAVGRARGIGTVDVYVAVSAGLPDEALLTEVQSELSNRREIAVDVNVLSPETKSIDIDVEISTKDGATFEDTQEKVKNALQKGFTGALLGKPILLAELGKCVYDVGGVANYHILNPTEDLSADSTVLPVLGSLKISAIEEAS